MSEDLIAKLNAAHTDAMENENWDDLEGVAALLLQAAESLANLKGKLETASSLLKRWDDVTCDGYDTRAQRNAGRMVLMETRTFLAGASHE